MKKEEKKRLAQIERKIAAAREKEMRWMFWYNLNKNHPLAYDLVQWMILIMWAAAVIISIICIATRG